MVIAGYAVLGVLTFLLALTGNLALAIGLAFGPGVANMVFVIPSQTLFQERTPPDLMGRVVGLPVRARLRVDDDRDGASGRSSAEIVGPRPGDRGLRPDDDGGRAGRLFVPAVRDA